MIESFVTYAVRGLYHVRIAKDGTDGRMEQTTDRSFTLSATEKPIVITLSETVAYSRHGYCQ